MKSRSSWMASRIASMFVVALLACSALDNAHGAPTGQPAPSEVTAADVADPSATSEASAGAYRRRYRNTSNLDLGTSMALLIIIGFVSAIAVAIGNARSVKATTGADAEQVDVGVLRIAVDGRARKRLTSELARALAIHDRATPQGRAALLRDVTILLRHLRDAWTHAGATNEPMQRLADAHRTYARHVTEATLIPTAPGQTTEVVLVSIMVATRGPLVDVTHVGDGEPIRSALEACAYRSPDDIVEACVIVHPDDDHALSRAALEAALPAPLLVRLPLPTNNTYCDNCGDNWPSELRSCPNCGQLADAA